ncbi:hypothetical protein ACNKHW_04785 [Shigella flexneri]
MYPCNFQMILFPLAATLEVTNATIAIYDEDKAEHPVELTLRFAHASAFTHVLLRKADMRFRPTIDTESVAAGRFPANSRAAGDLPTAPCNRSSTGVAPTVRDCRQLPAADRKNYQQERGRKP